MEKARFEIQHRLNIDLLMELYTITTSSKRNKLLYTILSATSVLLSVLAFLIGKDIWGCIFIGFFVLMMTYPSRRKKAIEKYYLKDENILKERTLYLYDDYLEVKTVSEDTKVEYAKLTNSIETGIGLYLYINKITAFCFPKDAFTPDALEYIMKKAQIK